MLCRVLKRQDTSGPGNARHHVNALMEKVVSLPVAFQPVLFVPCCVYAMLLYSLWHSYGVGPWRRNGWSRSVWLLRAITSYGCRMRQASIWHISIPADIFNILRHLYRPLMLMPVPYSNILLIFCTRVQQPQSKFICYTICVNCNC